MIVLKREHSRKNSLLMIAAALLISIICTVFLFPVPVSAQQDQTDVIPVGTGNDLTWQNTATGYGIYMEDNASLLSEEERARLISESMMPVTEYGNAGFISTTTNDTDTERYAKERYAQLFGSDSGTLLVVDMNRRVIALHSDGEIYRTITRNAADTIMDNVYKKASEGDYFGMASAAYSQILRKLAGLSRVSVDELLQMREERKETETAERGAPQFEPRRDDGADVEPCALPFVPP